MAESATWSPPDTDPVIGKAPAWSPPSTDKPISDGRLSINQFSNDKTPEQILFEKESTRDRIAATKAREKFVRENATPGTILDVDEQLPAGTRARLSLESDPKRQVELFAKLGIPARLSKDNRVIVKQGDKEVLLHPMDDRIRAGDFAGAAFPLAKAGVATGAAIASWGLSLPLQAAIQGGTAAVTQALGQGGSRVLAGQDLEGVAGESLKEGAINTALPLAALGVSKGAGAIRNALTKNAGPLEAAAPEAMARLGMGAPSAAESSGSPLLAKLGKLPPKEEALRQAKLDQSQGRAIGPSGRNTLESEAVLATKAKPIFSEAEQAAEAGTRRALTDAEKAAHAQIQSSLDSGIVPTNLKNSEAAGYIRTKFQDFLDKVKADAAKNYPVFHAKAAEEGIVLEKKPITDLIAKISKEDPTGAQELLAPSIGQVKKVETALTKPISESEPMGILDARGRPMMSAEIPAPDLTFDDAIKLRSIVRAKLNAPQDPLGDVVKSYYKRLDGALTESIDDGLKRGSPELRKAYETARGSYAAGADALDRGVVQKLFREAGEAGRVPDEDVIRQIFTGKGKLTALQDMKNILQPNDYKLLLRSGINNIVEEAKAGGQMIDAGKFLTRINSLDQEVRDEVLGPILEKALRNDAALLSRAQGKTVPVDELNDALAAGRNAGKLLKDAIAREDEYKRVFQGTVQRKLRDGVVDAATANDDRFISYLMGDAVSAADTRQALTQIAAKSPQTAEGVRQRVLQNVLDQSGVKSPLGREGQRVVFDSNPEVLDGLLKAGSPSREKLQAALGKDGVQFLDDLSDYAKLTAQRIENQTGRKVSTETLAKEGGSALLGFKRNAVGALVDTVSLGARAIGAGKLVRSPWFAKWIRTGELPQFNPALYAAPDALRAAKAIEEGKEGEPMRAVPQQPKLSSAPAPAKVTSDAPAPVPAPPVAPALPTLTPAEAKAAPAGTRFIGSNGKTYETTGGGKNKLVEPDWQDVQLPDGGKARVRLKK